MNARSSARTRMLAGTSVTERVLEVDGVSSSVLEAGSGPNLVLLHGGIECGGAYWEPVMSRLAERFRVVAPDVPGLGESAPVEGLDAERFAGWFSALIRVANVEAPIVVAHSLVGCLVARFAIDHSDELSRLVLYSAPGIGPYRFPLRLMYVATRLSLRPTPRNDERFARFALLDFDATRGRDVEWFDAFSTYSLERAVLPHVKRTMRSLINLGSKRIPDEALKQIAVPVDLLWGEGDRMVRLSLAQGASERLGWPLTVIRQAGHAPHIEQPEAFVQELTTIVDRQITEAAATNRPVEIRDSGAFMATSIGA